MLPASDAPMTRSALTTCSLATGAFLALLVALPHRAAAEETMCGLRGVVVVVVEASEVDALLTPGLPLFGAFSASPALAPAVAGDAGEVLWCASPDDPRCAPAHSGSGSTTSLRDATSLFIIPTSPPPVAEAPISTLADTGERLGAPSGVLRSIDRPPR